MIIDGENIDHFELIVKQRYRFTLESALNKASISFVKLADDKQLTESSQYYFKLSDRDKIDAIVVANEIIAHERDIPTVDYEEGRKILKWFLISVVVVSIITFLAIEILE